MKKEVRTQLLNMREEGYQKFSASLIPGVHHMLGIRLPKLRTLAKEIAKGDWEAALLTEDYYFEEKMLRGMVLSYASNDMDRMLPYIEAFIPLVDNWSICDSVFMGMTIFQRDRERTWEFIEPYLKSDKEFEIRIALIIMMQHLLKCDRMGKKMSRLRTITLQNLSDSHEEKGFYLDRIFTEIEGVDTSTYYASMAVAWLIAEAFCIFPYHTFQFLKDCHLDDRTYHKAIRKIIESKIPNEEVKSLLRSF